MRLSARKPEKSAYPKGLKTLGDHIRKRRLDLGLLQREVAKVLGVDVDSVCQWEMGHRQPKVALFPGIIDFLGYVPGEAGRLDSRSARIARQLAGLSRSSWPSGPA